ncbi:MAG TPA: VOC family protein [Pyrinomonadaceae bacterium]|nr:VOC family protein [Pyrinomonadaceae bacterium]
MIKFHSIIPTLVVADVGATMRWYEHELGFSGDPFPNFEPYVFGILRRDDLEIFLMRIEGYNKPDLYDRRNGGVWDAYLRVEGLKQLYETLKDRLEIKQPLHRQPYGLSEFEVRDPNGYILVFSELLE